ncbi:hypothetical protein [Brevibacterium litoralis]|uniref:hypothetical protein n=1 Tax=Brevibacterium litoralis TaxID=3138935 RepID=UPI0032F0950A
MTTSTDSTPAAEAPAGPGDPFVSPATALPLHPSHLVPVDPTEALFRVLDSGREDFVPLVTLVDEELSVLLDSERHRGGFPYLHGLAPELRDQAKETAARLLVARRLVHPVDMGGDTAESRIRLQATSELQGTVMAIRSSPQTVRAHRETAETATTLVHHQFTDLDRVVEEIVTADGTHVFSVGPLTGAAARLAAFVDPHGTARRTGDTRRVDMADVIRGDATMGGIETDARIVTTIHGRNISRWFPGRGVREGYVPGSMHAFVQEVFLDGNRTVPGFTERRVTVYVGAEDVTVAEATHDGPVLQLREVDGPTLGRLAAQFGLPDHALPTEIVERQLAENSREPEAFLAEASLRSPRPSGRSAGDDRGRSGRGDDTRSDSTQSDKTGKAQS